MSSCRQIKPLSCYVAYAHLPHDQMRALVQSGSRCESRACAIGEVLCIQGGSHQPNFRVAARHTLSHSELPMTVST